MSTIADISELYTPSALTLRVIQVKAPRGVPTKYGNRWVLEAVMQDRVGATIGVGQWAEDEASTRKIQQQWQIGQLVELKDYKGGKDEWTSNRLGKEIMKLSSKSISSHKIIIDTTFPDVVTNLLPVGDVVNGSVGDVAAVVVHVGDPTKVTLKTGDQTSKVELGLAFPSHPSLLRLELWGPTSAIQFERKEVLVARGVRWNEQDGVLKCASNDPEQAVVRGKDLTNIGLQDQLGPCHALAKRNDLSGIQYSRPTATHLTWATFQCNNTSSAWRYTSTYSLEARVVSATARIQDCCQHCPLPVPASSSEPTFRCSKCFKDSTHTDTWDVAVQLADKHGTTTTSFHGGKAVGEALFKGTAENAKADIHKPGGSERWKARLESVRGLRVTVEFNARKNPKTNLYAYKCTGLAVGHTRPEMSSPGPVIPNNAFSANAILAQVKGLIGRYRSSGTRRILVLVEGMLRNHASLLTPFAGEIVAAVSGLDVEGDLLRQYLAHVLGPQTLEQRADSLEAWQKMFGASVHDWLDEQLQQVLIEMYPAAAATPDPVPTRTRTSLLETKGRKLFADDGDGLAADEDVGPPPSQPSDTASTLDEAIGPDATENSGQHKQKRDTPDASSSAITQPGIEGGSPSSTETKRKRDQSDAVFEEGTTTTVQTANTLHEASGHDATETSGQHKRKRDGPDAPSSAITESGTEGATPSSTETKQKRDKPNATLTDSVSKEATNTTVQTTNTDSSEPATSQSPMAETKSKPTPKAKAKTPAESQSHK